jgi:hypothetical protein
VTGIGGSARDPFAVLGLRAGDDMTDDDVRMAWRRIAAAAHPDRADGGDPARYALAAAAYTELRTGFGRNEARAELTARAPAWAPIVTRVRWLLPVRLMLRLAVSAAAAVLGGTAAGWDTPAAPALVVGALTWLLVGVAAGQIKAQDRSRRVWRGRTTTPTTSRRKARRAGLPAREQAPDAPQ